MTMTDYQKILQDLLADLRIGISCLTRLPLGSEKLVVGEGDVARASWSFPVAGLLVAICGGIVYWLASRFHISPEPAAALVLAATTLFTGAMHEDGLADAADSLGGKTREQKLEIMRDSRIGSFGACALVLSFLLRWSALQEIAEPRLVTIALIAAHVASRAILPAFMSLVPPARADGLSSGAGQPHWQSTVAAIALGVVCLLFVFGPRGTLIGVLVLALAAATLAWLSIRSIGGQTGDVLGALQQVGESAVLLVAISFVSG